MIWASKQKTTTIKEVYVINRFIYPMLHSIKFSWIYICSSFYVFTPFSQSTEYIYWNLDNFSFLSFDICFGLVSKYYHCCTTSVVMGFPFWTPNVMCGITPPPTKKIRGSIKLIDRFWLAVQCSFISVKLVKSIYFKINKESASSNNFWSIFKPPTFYTRSDFISHPISKIPGQGCDKSMDIFLTSFVILPVLIWFITFLLLLLLLWYNFEWFMRLSILEQKGWVVLKMNVSDKLIIKIRVQQYKAYLLEK